MSNNEAEIEVSDPEGVIYRSVFPEISDIEGRSDTYVEHSDGVLSVRVEAPDRVALRAGVNTWLQLLETASEAGGV